MARVPENPPVGGEDDCDCPACQLRRDGGSFVAWLEAALSGSGALVVWDEDDDDDDDDEPGELIQ